MCTMVIIMIIRITMNHPNIMIIRITINHPNMMIIRIAINHPNMIRFSIKCSTPYVNASQIFVHVCPWIAASRLAC